MPFEQRNLNPARVAERPLRNILKNVTFYFPDGYTLCVNLQEDNINLFYEFMDIFVFADYNGLKLVMLIPLKTFERQFCLLQADHLPLHNFQFG
jgi:hypothetical protein